MRYLFLWLSIVFVRIAFSQTFHIGDSCLNHVVKYTRISENPVLYKVQEYLNGKLLFEAKTEVLYPPQKFETYLINYMHNMRYYFLDTCYLYEPNFGIVRKTVMYNQDNFSEDWKYDHKGYLVYHYKKVPERSYVLTEDFDENMLVKKKDYHYHQGIRKKSYEYIKKYNNGRLTEYMQLTNGRIRKLIKYDYIGNANEYVYKPKKWSGEYKYYSKSSNHYVNFGEDGMIYGYLKESDDRKKVIITSYYHNGNLDGEHIYYKRAYRNAKVHFGEWITLSTNPIQFKKLYENGDPEIIQKYNEEGEKVIDLEYRNKEYSDGSVNDFTGYEIKDNILKYYHLRKRGSISYTNKSYHITDTTKINDILETTEYWVGEIETSFLRKRNDKFWDSGRFEYAPGFKNEKEKTRISSYLMILEEVRYESSPMNYNEKKDSLFIGTDSFIVNKPGGQMEYFFQTGNKKITVRAANNKFKIAKDQGNCRMGIKSEDGKWIVNPTFDNIRMEAVFDNIFNYYLDFYYAFDGTLTALYNNQGQVMIPLSAGFGNMRIKFSKPFCKKHNLISSIGFILNDTKKDSFYVLSMFNNVLLKGKGILGGGLRYNAFIIHVKKLKGYLDGNGTLIEPIYNHIDQDKSHLILLYTYNKIKKCNDFQIADSTGKILSTKKFQKIEYNNFNNTIYTGPEGWAMSDNKGNVIFDKTGYELNARFYASHQELAVTNNEKHGLLDNDLKILIPLKYDAINVTSYCYFAHTADSSYVYDRKGNLLSAFSRFHVSMQSDKGFSKEQLYRLGDWRSQNPHPLFLIERNNKYGLIDHYGKIIKQTEYDDIGYETDVINENDYQYRFILEQHVVLVKDSIAITVPFFEGKIGKQVEHDYAWVYTSYYHSKNYLVQNTGKLLLGGIKYKVVFDKTKRTFLNQFYIHKDTATEPFLGVCDAYGDWVVRFTDFTEWKQAGKDFYVKTKEGKAGVINCMGHYLIKPQYDFIYFDPDHELLWYRNKDYSYARLSKRKNGRDNETVWKQQDYWKLKNIGTGVINPDSFDSPVGFDGGMSYTPFLKQNLLGVLGFDGKTLIEPIYQYIYTIKDYELFIFKKDEKYFAWDRRDKPKEQPYQYFTQPFGSYAYGFKDEKMYMLNSKYFAMDSTDNFFANNPQSMKHWMPTGFTDQGMRREKLKNLNRFGLEYFIALPPVTQLKQNIALILDIAVSEKTPHCNINKKESFPKMYDDNYLYLDNAPSYHTIKKSTTESEIFKVFSFSDIVNRAYKIVAESKNTLTLKSGSYTEIRKNIFLDLSKGVIEFSLQDVISDQYKDSLISILHASWLKMDNPNLPCINYDKIFDFFNNQFSVTDTEIIFIVNEKSPIIPIQRSKMLNYMKPVWKTLLM